MCNESLLPGLPPYEDGITSPALYNAGVGLHGEYNDGKPNQFEWRWKEEALRAYIERFRYTDYLPEKPYVYGDVMDITFSNGLSAYHMTKNGMQMTVCHESQQNPNAPDEVCMQRTVTQTDPAAFLAYIHGMEQLGFAVTWRHSIEDNLFFELETETRRIHAALTGDTARFTDIRAGVSIAGFGNDASVPDGSLELCQFGLYYSYMRPLTSADCGMLYILKLPDNTLFVVDGGEIEQATNAACAEVLRVMRLMSSAPESEKIPVAAWFCTHAHDDHMDLFAKLLRFHHDELDVQRAIFNFPVNEYYTLMPQTYLLTERINRCCPDIRYLKAQTGHCFTLAGVCFEVLLTHGDNTGAVGNETIDGFNNTSTVLKISYDGASFLLLGDTDNTSEGVLLAHYTEKTLHCTAVQAAHHLINRLDRLYPVVSPAIALVPQHIRKAMASNEKFMVLLNTVPMQNQYYAFCATDIFRIANGTLSLIMRFPIEGGIFGGSKQ